jgi:hypothetical protein
MMSLPAMRDRLYGAFAHSHNYLATIMSPDKIGIIRKVRQLPDGSMVAKIHHLKLEPGYAGRHYMDPATAGYVSLCHNLKI